MTFPKLIHIVWFQGVANLSRPAFLNNIKSWQILNPDWKVNCLDDEALKEQCRLHSAAALDVYSSFRSMHQKIDFGRFVTLYNQGGIYVDIDAYAFRPLTYNPQVRQLIQRYETDGQPILGLSSISTSTFEGYVMSQGESGTFINNAVMMGSPRHPELGVLVDNITSIAVGNPKVSLQDSTGPLIFGKFFRALISRGRGNIVVFAPQVFEPCTLDGACRISDETVSLHQFELSWVPGPLRRIAALYVRHSELICTAVLVAALVYLFRIRIGF